MHVSRFLGILLISAPVAPVAAQTAFSACYVPSIGAMYLIKRAGLPGACRAAPHLEVSWTDGGAIADGAVTSNKIADGAVSTAKIAPGTSVDLLDGLDATAFALAAHAHDNAYAAITHDHDGAYFPRAQLQAVGTLNAATNPVDWTKLKGVPAGFADGVDNDGGTGSNLICTGCVDETDIADQAISAAKIAFNTISGAQLVPDAITSDRILNTTIQTVDLQDGAVSTEKIRSGAVTVEKLAFDPATQAELDALAIDDGSAPNAGVHRVHWSVLNGVPAGFADGTDNDVTYTAGAGLALTGTAFAVAFAGGGSAATVARSDHSHAALGTSNTALGPSALASLTTGAANTGVGNAALRDNTGGSNNTAVGAGALDVNTFGASNTGIGINALGSNVTGAFNTGVGEGALGDVVSTSDNTAVGRFALGNTTGTGNIAVGSSAGISLGVGDANIYIGSFGTPSESGTIRIGRSPVTTRAFIGGITGVTIASGAGVFVSTAGQLGILTSSRRYKEAIADLGETSRRVLQLRPVQFRYRPEYDDGSALPQFGLIAEEVERVFPELVIYGPDGRVETVRYQALTPLLLNELQRQQRDLTALQHIVTQQQQSIAELRALVRALETRR